MDTIRRKGYGFTLLEVLVALVLLSLFALAAYRGLNAVMESEQHARREQAHWQKLARVFARIEADLQGAVVVAPAPGAVLPALMAEKVGVASTAFSLTRFAAEGETGGLQRVGYRFYSGQLTRGSGFQGGYQSGSQSGQANVPNLPFDLLLDGLESVSFRYLDAAGSWQTSWSAAAELPRAIEFVMIWPDGLQLRRVFLTL